MKHNVMTFEQFSKKTNAPSLNEGAGAGYNMLVGGLKIDPNTIEVSDIKSDKKFDYFEWKAKLQPCVMDDWATSSYYDGIDSEHSPIELDFEVKGGEVRGWMEDLDGYIDDNGTFKKEHLVHDLKHYLAENDGFTVYDMIGGGWIHTNLTNPFALGNTDYVEQGKVLKDDYRKGRDTFSGGGNENNWGIYYVSIDSPEFVDFVNDFYDDPQQYYE